MDLPQLVYSLSTSNEEYCYKCALDGQELGKNIIAQLVTNLGEKIC